MVRVRVYILISRWVRVRVDILIPRCVRVRVREGYC